MDAEGRCTEGKGDSMRTARRVAALALAASSVSWLPALAATQTAPLPQYRQAVPPAAPVTGLARNNGFEPMVAIDGTGAIWTAAAISQNDTRDPRNAPPPASYLTGADVWRSTDGGATFKWVGAPFNAVEDMPGLAGIDVDIAVAPERNSQGNYTVYVASGWVPGVALAYSTDAGKTWTVRHINNVALADRPWLTPTGACGIYITYKHQPSNDTLVNRFDLCNPATLAVGSALNPVTSTSTTLEGTAGLNNRPGKPALLPPGVPGAGTLIVPMLECQMPTPDHFVANLETGNNECTDLGAVDVGISTDGGLTFTNVRAATIERGRVPIWGVSAAVDAGGVVYVSWFDDLDAYIVSSRDAGRTWSRTTRLNSGLGTAAYPTVAAGRRGHVAVAWYGTTRRFDANDATPKGMGAAGSPAGAPWHLYIARSTDSGGTWSVQRVGTQVHRGALCTWGTSCAGNGDRNMFDNFGAVVSPTTGKLVVAHMADDLTSSVVNRWVVVTAER